MSAVTTQHTLRWFDFPAQVCITAQPTRRVARGASSPNASKAAFAEETVVLPSAPTTETGTTAADNLFTEHLMSISHMDAYLILIHDTLISHHQEHKTAQHRF